MDHCYVRPQKLGVFEDEKIYYKLSLYLFRSPPTGRVHQGVLEGAKYSEGGRLDDGLALEVDQ